MTVGFALPATSGVLKVLKPASQIAACEMPCSNDTASSAEKKTATHVSKSPAAHMCNRAVAYHKQRNDTDGCAGGYIPVGTCPCSMTCRPTGAGLLPCLSRNSNTPYKKKNHCAMGRHALCCKILCKCYCMHSAGAFQRPQALVAARMSTATCEDRTNVKRISVPLCKLGQSPQTMMVFSLYC